MVQSDWCIRPKYLVRKVCGKEEIGGSCCETNWKSMNCENVRLMAKGKIVNIRVAQGQKTNSIVLTKNSNNWFPSFTSVYR